MDVEHPRDAGAGTPVTGASGSRRLAPNLQRARDWHGAGRFDDAAREYEAMLASEPDNARALHLYGVLQYQRGATEQAQTLLRRSISLAPDVQACSDLGAILAESGRVDEALAQFDHALKLGPDDVQTLVRQGNVLIASRQYERALAAFDRVLRVSPLVLDALCNRGSALRALGRHQEALDTYDRALVVDPRSFESWFNRGLVMQDLRRTAEALTCFDRALEIRPGNATMLAARGHALVDSNRVSEALAAFNEAIAIEPGLLDAVYNSAVALERLGRAEEAIARCERVLAQAPGHVAALACRGNAWLQLGRYEVALSSYESALAIAPDAVEFLCNKGTALRFLTRDEQALQAYDAALARNDQFAEAWTNRSGVLGDLHRYQEAMTSLDRAMALRPDYATNWLNRGNLHYAMGREAEALQAYERSIELDADQVDAHIARASLWLAQGDFARGWPEYEWRLRDPAVVRHARSFAQPLWQGTEPLDGKTILIHAEQGFGDTVQFCRYASVLSAQGARVVLEVQPALRTLMASLDGGPVQVLSRGEPLPAFDYQCPLASLPRALGADLMSVPAGTPYLFADPQRVRHWAQVLGEQRRLRVGLAWAGNPRHRNDRHRSIDFAQLARLLELDIEWISLQKAVPEGDEALLSRTPLRRFDEDLGDFADTAALMLSLDLVISVDTAVAHLAGALGRPVWLLLASPSEWRWMRDRKDSPWYPDASLFRQPVPGDWASVVEAVRVAVAELTV
ncbi:tetratricopeptide repeat protein [Trinickia fusca]|uniref:Tetratricopeptide repeat protein n=1 Tax=Trinickia fusca TaxID=2419777 RepID=A0A494XP92_9BURK|nr:tetratricopeptide repeat protein [Trinickia fusca]RKP52470.1 tetratricopeptide repeat protein [Trinickia fusca]